MEKSLILQRLKLTIDKLKELPKREFDYSVIFPRCGTACCVAGHYQRWFPNVGIGKADTVASLKAYHGVSEKAINILFYGGDDIYGVDRINHVDAISNGIIIKYGMHRYSLADVIHNWEVVYNLIEQHA